MPLASTSGALIQAIMKSHLTERENVIQTEHFAYRILKLAQTNREKFLDLKDYLPFITHENLVGDFDYNVCNEYFKHYLGKHFEPLMEFGIAHLLKMVDLKVHDIAFQNIREYEKKADSNSICTYFQRINLSGEFEWFLSYKIFSEENKFLTVVQPVLEMGNSGALLIGILGETCINRNGWELFKTLTKREKQIMQLLAKGMTSQQISDQLCVSKFTVDTHRKNLFHKLEVKNYAQLFKIVQGFGLLDLEENP